MTNSIVNKQPVSFDLSFLKSDFNSYKKMILDTPSLSEKEERDLLVSFKVENSMESAKSLILSQLKTVLYVSSKFSGYGLSEEDLVQEGTIGLMKAVRNYDLSHKVRLYTYSLLWIKAEIQNYVLCNWRVVNFGSSKNFKKLFFNFRKTQQELIKLGVRPALINSLISKKVNVPEDDVDEIASYFDGEDVSVDLLDGNEGGIVHNSLVEHQTPEAVLMVSHDSSLRNSIINEVMVSMPEKYATVLRERFFSENKKTYKDIGLILNVSSERARQIEKEAMVLFRDQLEDRFRIKEVF